MLDLTEKIFNEEINQPVVHETLRWYLSSRRQGTQSAKTRSEVSGGGHKPWKQKGTGRARAGSNRSPLWRKGGVIFPPKPRSYAYTLPQKMKQLALRVALSEKRRDDKLKLIDRFTLAQPKTKDGVRFIKDLGVSGKVLLVLAETAADFTKGVRNIAGVTVTTAATLNIFDLLNAEWLVIEQPAIAKLEKRLNG